MEGTQIYGLGNFIILYFVDEKMGSVFSDILKQGSDVDFP